MHAVYSYVFDLGKGFFGGWRQLGAYESYLTTPDNDRIRASLAFPCHDLSCQCAARTCYEALQALFLEYTGLISSIHTRLRNGPYRKHEFTHSTPLALSWAAVRVFRASSPHGRVIADYWLLLCFCSANVRVFSAMRKTTITSSE